VISALFMNIQALQATVPKKRGDTDKVSVVDRKEQKKLTEAEVQKLLARINEISKIDVKSLPGKERRELRREVRDIRDTLNKNADGFSIYIGGGALIVILLLLILLL
ncbi:MAG TPA: hypothetical protein VHO90_07520, partial [Bacteroidales bacterium]|nr:hypothetical protein [Bacteroidales bacterium]